MTTFQERSHYRAVQAAVYRGATYQAGGSKRIQPLIWLIPGGEDPIPADLEPYRTGDDTIYLVDPAQLDAWYRSRWTFTWRGEPFTAIGASSDTISGYYEGSNAAFADEHLTRLGATEYRGTAPLDEVEDLTEHREDLLAAWRNRQVT